MPRDFGADQATKSIRVAVRRHQEALPYCLECRTTSGGGVLESRFAVQRLNRSVHELRRRPLTAGHPSADLDASSAALPLRARFWRWLSGPVATPGRSGTESRQIKPSERQSNSACPPSCDSMLAMTLLVPNPRDAGLSTRGPSLSSHTIWRTSARISHLMVRRPASVDSAPYFAELVTSSCSA